MASDSTPTGSVLPTPEAGPLTPPSMRDHYTTTTQSTPEGTVSLATPPAGGAAEGAQPGAQRPAAGDEAPHDLGERLKPVLEAAEDVAVKALDLSARGLSKLVDVLEERRRDRDS